MNVRRNIVYHNSFFALKFKVDVAELTFRYPVHVLSCLVSSRLVLSCLFCPKVTLTKSSATHKNRCGLYILIYMEYQTQISHMPCSCFVLSFLHQVKLTGSSVPWCPATLIFHRFTPTKDGGIGRAKSTAYWLVHGSVSVGFVMSALRRTEHDEQHKCRHQYCTFDSIGLGVGVRGRVRTYYYVNTCTCHIVTLKVLSLS